MCCIFGQNVIVASLLVLRPSHCVRGGMLPWSRRARHPTQLLPCSWPTMAVWWQHAVPSQECCHSSVLYCFDTGDRKGIWP